MSSRDRKRLHQAAPIQDLKITWVAPDSLTPNPRNARTHSRKQIKALATIIDAVGFTKPIVTDGARMVVAGHGCLAAAKLLELPQVPVVCRADLSKEQIRLYALADNKLAEKSGWDFELLAIELKELEDLGVDLSLTGFEFAEVDALFEGFCPKHDAEDDVPPTSANVPGVARPGDLVLLGKHRLLCGDATNADDAARVLDGTKPVLMATDPPYGVSYDPSWRHRLGVNTSKRSRGIQNDDCADWRSAFTHFPGDIAFVWHSALHAHAFYESLVACDFEIRAQIIWAKNRIVIGRGDYHWQHEPAFYAVRNGRPANFQGNRKQSTVWNISTVSEGQDLQTEHSTQKPVECMRRPILNSSRVGQGIYDPFLGSGTTLIAAERTGRVAFGLEIDPRYVDVSVRRWQRLTGKDATLAGTNKTFEEIAEERRLPSKPRETRAAKSRTQ